MKKTAIGILAVVLAVAIFIGVKFLPNKGGGFPYGRSSSEIQVSPKENDFAVGRRTAYQVRSGDIEGEAILTPVHSATEADAMVDSQIFGVKSAFQERPAPYGGQITALIACDPQKYVKEQTVPFAGKDARLLLAVASGRKVYGSCSAEEIKYASIFLSAFDDARGQAITVKLFKPVANMAEIQPSQEALLKILHHLLSLP
jgi:hypothetical protein